MRYPQSKLLFETEQEIKSQVPSGYRVVKIDWTGPGWYAIFCYDQPCPRGCCRDNVYEVVSMKKWAETISCEIKVLANHLKEARMLQNNENHS